jgi:hypothetical protein
MFALNSMSLIVISLEDGRQPDQLGPAVIHQLVCGSSAVNGDPRFTVKAGEF